MRKEIAFGTFFLVLSNILSRVLGLARDSLLAHRGGLSLDVDAYNLAFLIPDLINHFLGAGLLPVTLIPLLMPYLKDGRMDQASHFVSRLLNAFGFIIIIGCCFAFWKMETLLPLICDKNLSPELLARTAYYSRILLFAQVFFVSGGFFNAMQYGSFKFFLPALAPLAYNGLIILGGWLAPGGTVEGFCWGVFGGAFLGSFVFQWIGAYQAGFRWRLVIDFFHPDLFKYLWRTLPFLFGASAVFANEFVYRRFGGGEVGSLASLGFGLRISMALSGVLGGAVGIAVYPWFAQLCSEGKQRQLSAELSKLLQRVSVVLVPVLVVIYASAEILVRFYLGSGHFDHHAVERVSPFLQAYLWQVIPMTTLLLVNRSFYADQRTWVPSLISLGLFAISLPIYSWLAPYGSIRIPWISTATTTVTVLILFSYWLYHYPGSGLLNLCWQFSKVLVVAGLCYLALNQLYQLPFFHQGRSLSLLLGELALVSICLILQWILLSILGVTEARRFTHSLFKKIKGLRV